MLESEEPHPFSRNWAIPWFANAAIWSVTVSAVMAFRTFENPKLLIGPLPLSEQKLMLALADAKTVMWPLGAAFLLVLFGWLMVRRPARKRKGRNSGHYLLRQLVDEFRSFSLNAGSLLACTSYYAQSSTLIGPAVAAWLLWVVLQWFWLKENGASSLDG